MGLLTDNPRITMEALVVMVRRAGGKVVIKPGEGPGPYNLMAWVEGNELHLELQEGEALRLLTTPAAGSA